VIEHVVTTPDGRRLRVVEAGNPNGTPVLMHHGTPGTGELYGPHVQDATEKGIRLIGYDRPGYGGSDRHEGFSPAATADDVRAIARSLGIERLATWGFSGGGPHVLACAALLPDLLVAACSMASPAPYGAPGLDYFAGMGQQNVDDMKLMLEDPAAVLAKLPADRDDALGMTPETMRQNMQTLISDADAAAHNAQFAAWIVGSMHRALAATGDGWFDDGMSQLRPWGFEVESIGIPFQLWHGRQDRFVPVQHGEWLAAHIPGIDAHITDEDGHGTVVQYRVPEVHSWLLERFG
jgi:pimeloyl-ACP methyl ester carboxylesterase